MANECTVYNLATGKQYTYWGLEPAEALVSAAILEDKRAGDLTDKKVRSLYLCRVLECQKRFLSIGDLTVKL